MRLKKRECNDEAFFDEVFEKAEDLALAMKAGDYPYVVPVNFVQEKVNDVRRIYIHCAREGRKIDLLREDARVAFMLHADVEIDREHSTTAYKCLCGTGKAAIVEDTEEKGRALDAIAMRYQARCHVPARPEDIERVAILRIDVESLSGKRRPRKTA
ncbi:MAG TPA: pyridoxamine 5'-phosphate oxidase family protein [Candidatus Mailhella merdavium]|nr:pyridoxamine 5'-phosphate oxidase family protein [Candidatus Mailhella merdavium]